jgi:Protein of unknown function (DUF1524)
MARSRARGRIGLLLLPLLLIAVLAGWVLGDDPGAGLPAPSLSPATPAPPASPGSAAALLESLPVKGRAPKTGYEREERFGEAWTDVDRNGCDTRNDILTRDLTGIERSGSCRVLTGELVSPYTRDTVHFVRGEETSALVQIDHVVALSNAWQTGAQQLSDAERELFANDPLNLLAVDGASNSQKSDADAATWLPANRSFWCPYVARQISVKAAYGLWVTSPERAAMRRVLERCPDQPALASSLAP